MDMKTLVDWSTVASGIGTATAACIALIAIPLAFRQQRESGLVALENNVTQTFLSYLGFRAAVSELEMFETGPDGNVRTTSFDEDKTSLCNGQLSCVTNAVGTLVAKRQHLASVYRSWGDILLKDATSVYNYLVGAGVGAAIDLKQWRNRLPAERQSRIDAVIEEYGGGLAAMAVQIQKTAVTKGATEATFQEVMGLEAIEVLVAFNVEFAKSRIAETRRLSWEVVKIRNVLCTAFGNDIDSHLKDWDIDQFVDAAT